MFIQTESTPNPATLKFLPGHTVLQNGTADFPSRENLHKSPLAKRIFNVEGVSGVFFGSDFITVTLKDANWENVKIEILSCISNHYLSELPFIKKEGLSLNPDDIKELNDETSIKINEIIEDKVRPAVARDGGDIIFNKFENGIVYITMRGSCDGCPASTMTLKNGVENLLKHYIPEVESVVPLQND